MTTLRQTPLTCSGHTRPVVFLAFSDLDSNGSYYAISACKDGKPMLRQGDTGDWIGTFEGHKGAVWGVDINGPATLAGTAAADFSAKVWNAVSGSELFHLSHKHIVKSVYFSRQNGSSHLVTGSNDKLVRIYDLEKHENPLLILSGHTSGIKQVFYVRSDKIVLSAGAEDKSLRCWDPLSGLIIRQVSLDDQIRGVELSKDGNILTIASGKSVCFYDVDTFQEIKKITTPSVINSASFLQAKNIVICGGEDFLLYKYDYDTHKEIDNFKGHFGPVHCVRFSPDGELYASGSEDGTLRLWQTEVGKTYGLWKCINGLTGVSNILGNKSEIVT